MGYGHFWYLKNFNYIHQLTPQDIRERDQHNFSIAFDICLKILPHYIRLYNLCDEDGENSPVFSPNIISFNGTEDRQEACEPFTLYRSLFHMMKQISSCKTSGLPYDDVVVLCLWICSKVCDEFFFGSDGGEEITEEEDYTEELVKRGIEFVYQEQNQLTSVIFKDIHGNVEKIYNLM
jgi:hypothetical protein